MDNFIVSNISVSPLSVVPKTTVVLDFEIKNNGADGETGYKVYSRSGSVSNLRRTGSVSLKAGKSKKFVAGLSVGSVPGVQVFAVVLENGTEVSSQPVTVTATPYLQILWMPQSTDMSNTAKVGETVTYSMLVSGEKAKIATVFTVKLYATKSGGSKILQCSKDLKLPTATPSGDNWKMQFGLRAMFSVPGTYKMEAICVYSGPKASVTGTTVVS
jgi:hypothetical protein